MAHDNKADNVIKGHRICLCMSGFIDGRIMCKVSIGSVSKHCTMLHQGERLCALWTFNIIYLKKLHVKFQSNLF